MSNSVPPHRWQPTRLPHPWDSPSKNTGVGCHFLLQCIKVKSESEVAQSCPTLCDPMNCSPPGSSVHGIFQARVLEWVPIAFSYPLQYSGLGNSMDCIVHGIANSRTQLSDFHFHFMVRVSDLQSHLLPLSLYTVPKQTFQSFILLMSLFPSWPLPNMYHSLFK